MVRLTQLIQNPNVFQTNKRQLKTDNKINFVKNAISKHQLAQKHLLRCPISTVSTPSSCNSHNSSGGHIVEKLSWTQQNEHYEKYQQHRKRVQNAKSIVNSQAPRRRNPNYVERKPTFMELMESLCKHHNLRTFTKAPESVLQKEKFGPNTILPFEHRPECPFHKTKSSAQINADKADKTIKDTTKRQRKNVKNTGCLNDMNRKSSKLNIPERILERYHHIYCYLERDYDLLRKLLRPKVYFDLEVKGVRPLGRIIIQLFTEACPAVVVEFVRTCLNQNTESFSITRLFPPLWFEGELALNNNQTLAMPNIEHDMRVLNHGISPGILSFPSRYVRGTKRNYLSFSISFKPLNVLNGKRVAFGRIRRGLPILDVIQSYGTFNGRPHREIVVKKCGLLQN